MTKLPFSGEFKVTCEYGRRGNAWKSGVHSAMDLVGITNKKVYSIERNKRKQNLSRIESR